MTTVHKLLVFALAIELTGLAVLWRRQSRAAPLPPVDWKASLIEESVASEIRELEKRLRVDDPASWAELAAMYRTFGLFPQADYCYRQVNRLGPRDRRFLYYWAECLDLMGRTQEARTRYREIIDSRLEAPLGEMTTPYCWLNIGQDLLREENVPGAIEALQKAPQIPKAKFLLSRVLIRAGRSAEAVTLLDQLLRESPSMVEFLQMKSWAEAELGNQEAAQDLYEQSLRSRQELWKWDPTYQEVLRRRNTMGSQAWHQKSLELEAAGQLKEAIEWSRRAVQAFWAEDRIQQLAKLELLTGHPKEAVALAEQCVGKVGASAKTLDIIGVASIQLGDSDKARRVWEQAAGIEPTPGLYQKLAELQRMAGNSRQVGKYQALEQYQMGKEAWLTNALPAALQYFQQAVALDDGDAKSWFYLAETRRFLGDAAGAEISYRRCLKLDPNFGRAHRGLERLKAKAMGAATPAGARGLSQPGPNGGDRPASLDSPARK